MSLKLYMDEHVQGPLTEALRRRGVDVLTAQEDGHDGSTDPELLDRASMLGRVLFTQDEDLLAEAAHRQQNGIPFGGVIYAHQLRVSFSQCLQDLELIAGAGIASDLLNHVQWLPFR